MKINCIKKNTILFITILYIYVNIYTNPTNENYNPCKSNI